MMVKPSMRVVPVSFSSVCCRGWLAPRLRVWQRSRGSALPRNVDYELAGREVHKDFASWTRRLLNATDPDADYIDSVPGPAGVTPGPSDR